MNFTSNIAYRSWDKTICFMIQLSVPHIYIYMYIYIYISVLSLYWSVVYVSNMALHSSVIDLINPRVQATHILLSAPRHSLRNIVRNVYCNTIRNLAIETLLIYIDTDQLRISWSTSDNFSIIEYTISFTLE